MIFVWDTNPVAFSVMGYDIRWYGLFFATALYAVYFSLRKSLKSINQSDELIDNFFFGAVVAIIVGARLFHFVMYEPSVFITNPERILNLRTGGLASHGGIIVLATWLLFYCKKHELSIRAQLDALVFPMLFFSIIVRVGNFFNSEIYGVPTNEPWGVVFSHIDSVPRYPTQLIEAMFYSLLCLSLSTANLKELKKGTLFSCLMISMSIVRLVAELTKEFQSEIASTHLTVGGILSIITLILGILLSWTFQKGKK